jgi:LuxR family maltose regulon positive regulatory protein
LARLQEADRAGGRINHLIRLLVLQALAKQGQGDIDQALSVLGEAFSLAEPEGYVWTFVKEGEPMHALLEEAEKHAVSPDYVNKLLDVFRAEEQRSRGAEEKFAPSAPPLPGFSALVEPLSDREIEVLRLIADGLSNQEIADRLVIAVSTVKSHVNHIFGKLGVRNRTQAAKRAQDLGLL